MPDRRTIKIVISTISVGDNFETMENDGDAQSEVFDVTVDDHVSLYRALIRYKRLIEGADWDGSAFESIQRPQPSEMGEIER